MLVAALVKRAIGIAARRARGEKAEADTNMPTLTKFLFVLREWRTSRSDGRAAHAARGIPARSSESQAHISM